MATPRKKEHKKQILHHQHTRPHQTAGFKSATPCRLLSEATRPTHSDPTRNERRLVLPARTPTATPTQRPRHRPRRNPLLPGRPHLRLRTSEDGSVASERRVVTEPNKGIHGKLISHGKPWKTTKRVLGESDHHFAILHQGNGCSTKEVWLWVIARRECHHEKQRLGKRTSSSNFEVM